MREGQLKRQLGGMGREGWMWQVGGGERKWMRKTDEPVIDRCVRWPFWLKSCLVDSLPPAAPANEVWWWAWVWGSCLFVGFPAAWWANVDERFARWPWGAGLTNVDERFVTLDLWGLTNVDERFVTRVLVIEI